MKTKQLQIVAECNEGACKMQRMEEMLVISQQIDFKSCKVSEIQTLH